MSINNLPPSNTRRWVIRRKATVVAALGGLITLNKACHHYDLSIDEFISWQRQFDKHGINELRATRGRDLLKIMFMPLLGNYCRAVN